MTDSKEEMFHQHRHIARSVARYFATKYNRPIEEALDHTEFALAVVLYDGFYYDPKKSSLSTWISIKVKWYVMEIYRSGHYPRFSGVREPYGVKREKACSDKMLEWENGKTKDAPTSIASKPNWLHNVLQEVGEEGAALINIISDVPQDLIEEVCSVSGRTQDNKQQNLADYLTDVLDWPIHKVEKAFVEVQACLCR